MIKNFHIKAFISTLILGTLCSCSLFDDMMGNDQYTNKLEAPSFVSELYGFDSRVITVTQPNEGHISWIGFVQSNDYKYFKMTRIQSGSKVIRAEGKNFIDENDEQQTYTPSSNTIIENISVGSTSGANNDFINGSINIAGGSDLKITVKYSPTIAIEDEEDPHVAYLIIYYDSPKEGAARIKLTGYTDGVKDEKCAQDVSTFEAIPYKFVNDEFDFYFCGSEVKATGQANIDPADPNFRNDHTNLTVISTLNATTGESQGVTFYKADDETVCLLSEKLTGSVSSIPDFRFFIPDGLAPVEYIDLSMVEGSYAECSLDKDNNITCPGTLMIDTLVSVSGLTITNQTLTADEMETSECTGFGEMTGSNALGDAEMTLVMKGTILSDANTEEYGIVDNLVAAEIKLEQ